MALLNGNPVEPDDNGVVSGTNGDDMIFAEAEDSGIALDGGSGTDVLFSEEGADSTTMDGGSGGDVLAGGGTNDTASYANDPSNDPAGVIGVVVDLSNFSAIDGTGGIDTLVGIENVTGSRFNDTLTGDDLANVLQGGAGDDTLKGNDGNDVFKYSFNLTQGGGETFSFTEFFAEHGGTVTADAEVADGTSQGQFSSLYTQWLQSLGLTVLDLGQNSGPDGMPVVEGPDGTFGERESFTWTSGSATKTVTHERWYSDTWSTGDGQDAVTSDDGFDTIVDFDFTEDKLEFNGLADLTLDQFASFFDVTEADVDGNGSMDTMLALADGTWDVTLLDVSGHTVDDFYGSSIFS